MVIDDAYLYKYVPMAEVCLMNRIPAEEELNHQFSRWFCRKMKAMIKYERRTPRERAVYRGLKVAFATLAVILLVAFGSAMSVKAYRYRIIEFFVEVLEELTTYSVQEEKPTGDTADLVEPSYVPAGYEVTSRTKDNRGCFVSYENESGYILLFRQELLSIFVQFWDTEASIVREELISNQKVDIIEESNMRVVYWTDDTFAYAITGAKDVELKELLKMAGSIIK